MIIARNKNGQAFANFLARDDINVLDEFGGTAIYQTSQSQVIIQDGKAHLKSVRLTNNGLIRWYASCCNTPIGNTINAKVPLVGLIHSFIELNKLEAVLGPVRAYVQTQDAIGSPDYPRYADKFPLGTMAHILWKMLVWKSQGKTKPSAFFDDNGNPVSEPKILNQSPTTN